MAILLNFSCGLMSFVVSVEFASAVKKNESNVVNKRKDFWY